MQEIESLVKKGTNRLNRFFYLGVVIGTVMGPLVLLIYSVPAWRQHLPDGENPTHAMLFGGLMTLLFGIALVEQFFKYARDRELLWKLRHNPRDIVWVYKEVREGRVQHRAGSQGALVARYVHVCFHMANGRKVTVWLSDVEANLLLTLVKNALPHASTGYSRELEEAYKETPTQLRFKPQHVAGVKRESGGVRMNP
jgi:hypothetical protein